MPARALKISLALLLFAAIVGLWASGLHEQIEPEALRAQLRGTGWWGPLLFVLAFTFVQPLFVSGHIFVIAATLVWDWWLAIPLAWVGAIGCAMVSFAFARYVARDWVQARLSDRLRKYESRLDTHAFSTVVLVRLIFWVTPPVQMLLGTSRVRFRPFLAGTIVGMVPGVLFSFAIGTGLAKVIFG